MPITSILEEVIKQQGPRSGFSSGGGGGGLTRTRKREATRGSGGMLPRENLKYYSSEMARNASKIR